MSKRIYLDYAAATPLDPEIKKVMEAVEEKNIFANPSSLHEEGREARAVIDKARDSIAKILSAQTSELIFTSGATESNVLALRGILWKSDFHSKHVAISKIEHPGVIELGRQFEKEGVEVTWLRVDDKGLIDKDFLADSVKENTVFVSVGLVNHELGTVQDIEEIAKIVKEKNPDTYFHTDAAQGFGWVDLKLKEWNIDLATFSSYKIYGPKGVGLLYIRDIRQRRISPLRAEKFQPLFPGFQEWGKRAGTESTSLIAGFAKACELVKDFPREQVRELRDDLISKIEKEIDGVRVNTPQEQSTSHIAHFLFKDIDSQLLNIVLDKEGLASSPGSACSSGAVQRSHVVEALGIGEEGGTLRLSLGKQTTQGDIDRAVEIIKQAVDNLRT